ncbi:MAG: peptide chain release factor N(5)-glutamine methyltransferase [Thiolinea sp.]
MARVTELLREYSQRLETISDSPRLDVEILLAHCLNKPRSFLYTWPEHRPAEEQFAEFNTLITQRLSGQPIAYLTNQREFWGLMLKVTPDTLIPRPDTELLVEAALQQFQPDQALSILDLGTGSGAIAIALASEFPAAHIIATDKSTAALAVAQENALQHYQHNIQFIESDWFSAVPDKSFDLILSNPPYIAEYDPHLTRGDVQFEPLTALTSGHDGLDDIRHLISCSQQFLRPQGVFMLEHGYDQASAIRCLLEQEGFNHITCLQDLAGNDRVSCGHSPASAP